MRHPLAAFALLFLLSAPATAAEEDDFEMTPSPPPGRVKPQVLGAQLVADPVARYPATLKFNIDGLPCTSTVVGPRAILTAAHCIPPNARGSVSIGTMTVRLTCEHHPRYAADYRYDLALCVSEAMILLPGQYSQLRRSTSERAARLSAERSRSSAMVAGARTDPSGCCMRA